MNLSNFDFTLPEALIALHPPEKRDGGRLLCVNSTSHTLSDSHITQLPNLLRKGDVLVFNTTKVIPAALKGIRKRTSMNGNTETDIEVNLLKEYSTAQWQAFVRPLKRLKINEFIEFENGVRAQLSQIHQDGSVTLIFYNGTNVMQLHDFYTFLEAQGKMPLPPYIARKRKTTIADNERYQTIFARENGSVAAPTASLHFTPELIDALSCKGVEFQYVTLHVGAGTFLPVKVDNIQKHKMHAEWGEVSSETANALLKAKRAGHRIIPVGTTSLRLLEAAAHKTGSIKEFKGETDIFITPGFKFNVADAMITNFHLPKSTLFMLVSALGGLSLMHEAYQHAIHHDYRFFSYGDACFIE